VPTTHASRLAEMANAYRDALEARNAAAVDRMAHSWLVAQQRVNVEMASLVSKIEAARLAGITPSPAWLYQERRLAQLTDTINGAIREWLPHAQAETAHLANVAMAEALEASQALSREAARTGLPGLEASFTDINPANMAQLLAHTAEGGPLHALLASIGGDMADQATNVLIQGVTSGKGSAWITRELANTLDIPRHRAETIARTEALRVYRETSRLTYASSNVVGSWTWLAALDRRTCPACVMMNGTHHPVTETLDGHPRCRCAMVPRTKTWEELGLDPSLDKLPDTRPDIPLGKDWLEAQPPSVQRGVMGPGKYDAWKAGDLSLEDMVARTHSPEWGTMRRERSMIEIREGRNANWMPELDTAETRRKPVHLNSGHSAQ
jgi:SPP1 gp7 family putative phage head morphogenesis protein